MHQYILRPTYFDIYVLDFYTKYPINCYPDLYSLFHNMLPLKLAPFCSGFEEEDEKGKAQARHLSSGR